MINLLETMHWFKKHTAFLEEESRRLSTDSNYKEIHQCRNNYFVSHGEVIVRLNKVYRNPILIIYSDATPYQLPWVFPLQRILSIEEVEDFSKTSPNDILFKAQSVTKFYYEFRHQNRSGNLCTLEADNLDTGSQFYSITSILKRVRDWYAGHVTGVFPLDNLEMDYCANFPFVDTRLSLLYPDGFLNEKVWEGNFYAQQISADVDDSRFIFYGCLIDGFNRAGLIEENSPYLFHQYIDSKLKTALDFISNNILVSKLIDEKKLLYGIWFDIDHILTPFQRAEELVTIIGNGKEDEGLKRLDRVAAELLKNPPENLYIGIRFPNKREKKEFQIFKLILDHDAAAKFDFSLQGLVRTKAILNWYGRVEASHSEKFTKETFHQRNEGRANLEVLTDAETTLFGLGSIGSEIADALNKAGIGKIRLADYETMDAVNSIRHLAGIRYMGVPKTDAIKEILRDHNPYTNIHSINNCNLYIPELIYALPNESLIISSVADDNLEGFINEHAVIAGKSVFYVRALRGGKVGRIFRVIPGKDACFQCLSLYREEPGSLISIPDDPTLPTIKNECNNPIRPGSAADLKIISSIASRIIIDHLQDGPSEVNHWIWSTEVIETAQIATPYSVTTHKLSPHPNCFYCNHEIAHNVVIKSHVLNYLKQLVEVKKGIETGGVLAGIEQQDGSILITHASGPGPQAKHEQFSFQKDIGFCQTFLDDLYKETNEEIKYVGEWHSHPDANNHPSGIDIRSLSDIGNQGNYLTANPVMIIFSATGAPSCSVHPMGKAHYFTDLNIQD